MKNYEEIFAESNQAMVKQTKNKEIIGTIVFGIIVPVVVYIRLLFFITTLKDLDSIRLEELLFLFLVLVLMITIACFVFSWIVKKFYNKPLKKLAKEFATTVYFKDLLVALESRFTLTNEFKSKLSNLIENYSWLNDNLTFDPNGATFDYENDAEELLQIIDEENIYYLTAWQYFPILPFTFIFDKVNKKGEIERDIEIRLPVGE